MDRTVSRAIGGLLPALTVIAAFAATGGGVAAAQSGDGLYGRFDASSSFVLGAGATFATEDGRAGALLDARYRIVDAAGLATSVTLAPDRRTRLFAGIELRPLFPALFLQSMSTGRWFLDLLIQSLGVELGADVALASRASVGFVWGLSLELPILTPERFAHGLGLRLGMRHTAFFGDARPNPAADRASGYQVYALLALGFDVGNAVANWEPRRFRER